jgi:hypothetical protein
MAWYPALTPVLGAHEKRYDAGSPKSDRLLN